MPYPRIMLAGTNSGVGKTTVSLGLMKALARKGHNVQPFKAGPDYIDPGLHFMATGKSSHNLDSWMGSADTIKNIFFRNASPTGIAVIEGVMGLFDGARGEAIKGSSAELALMLKTPVLLLVNARGIAQSCVALIKGYLDYCPELDIKGVILNHSSDFHRNWVKPNIENELGIDVIGCLPHVSDITMPERHLGLLPAEENGQIVQTINKMADLMDSELDLEKIEQIAGSAPDLEYIKSESRRPLDITIGVARDEAFTFYYQDSLDYLEEMGARQVYFSPLRDSKLPEIDGLYLGGGFPEMFLERLAGNREMLEAIRSAYQNGLPIFAECGGYMYLSKSIKDWEGGSWNGAGVIPLEIEMSRQLQDLGYVEATVLQDSIIAEKGDVLRGHVFHYSQARGLKPGNQALSLNGGRKKVSRREGFADKNVFASYLHLHLRSNPLAAENFIEACRNFRSSQKK